MMYLVLQKRAPPPFVLVLTASLFRVVKGDQDEDDSTIITYDEIYRVAIFLIAVHYMGELCTLANMPTLIGQLVAGVILGPPLTGFVPIEKGLVMLGEIGLIFNMFEVGIELDVALLRKTGTRAIIMAFFGGALALGAGIGVGIAFGLNFQGAFVLGSVFSQTASATLVPVLKIGKLLNKPVGQMILAATVVDDLITLILLSVMEVFGPSVEGISTFEYFVPVLTSMTWILVLGVIAITLAPRVIENLILPKLPQQSDKHFVLFAMMCVIFVAYLPLLHYTKASYLTGAFLCGATFSQVDMAHDTFFEKSQGFMDWGYKLYFAARLGFQVPVKLFGIPSVWILGSVLTFTAVAIKFLCAIVVPNFQPKVEKGALYNPHRHDQIVVGLSMMNRGGFGFLVASLAVEREIIDKETYASAIVALLLGIFVPAYLLTSAIRRFEKIRLRAQKGSNPTSVNNRTFNEDGKMPFFVQIHLETKGAWGLLENIAHDMSSIGLQVENFNANRPVIVSDLFLRDSTMRVMIPDNQVKSIGRLKVDGDGRSQKAILRATGLRLSVHEDCGLHKATRRASLMFQNKATEMVSEKEKIEKRCIEIRALVQDKVKQFEPTVVEIAQWDPYNVDNALDIMLLTRANGEEPSMEFFQNFFTLMDKDGDGFVTEDELKRGLMGANFVISEEGFAILMRSIDLDNSGIISFDDWSDTVELYLQKKKQLSMGTDASNANRAGGKNPRFPLRQMSSCSLLPDEKPRFPLRQMSLYSLLSDDDEKGGQRQTNEEEERKDMVGIETDNFDKLSQDDDDIEIHKFVTSQSKGERKDIVDIQTDHIRQDDDHIEINS